MEQVFSQAIPDLFTPEIITSTRCVAELMDSKIKATSDSGVVIHNHETQATSMSAYMAISWGFES